MKKADLLIGLTSIISSLGMDNIFAMLGLEDKNTRMVMGMLLFVSLLYLQKDQ